MTRGTESLLSQAAADGVVIWIGHDGFVKVRGQRESVFKWVPKLRANRDAIKDALRSEDRQQSRRPPTPPDGEPEAAFGRNLPMPRREAAVEDVLKGSAVLVVMDADDTRVWLVADEEDAAKLGDVGADTVMTRDEIRVLAAIRDPDVRAEVLAFKKTLQGRLRAEDHR